MDIFRREKGIKGEPGQPGEEAVGQTGGRGGEGGRGGAGKPEGAGGKGGEGGRGAQGEPGKPGKEGLPPWWRALLTLWIIGASVAIYLGYNANNKRVDESHKIIVQIQESRVESCQANYEGIRKVFKPFFPDPRTADSKQLTNLVRFNRIIDHQKKQCVEQTKVASLKDTKK